MDQDDSNGGPNHLRAWRERKGISQEELAKRAETTHQVIGYLERGRTQLSAKWLRKLAPLLDTTAGFLLDHDPNELPADIIEIWLGANKEQRKTLTDLAKVVVGRTGTDGE